MIKGIELISTTKPQRRSKMRPLTNTPLVCVVVTLFTFVGLHAHATPPECEDCDDKIVVEDLHTNSVESTGPEMIDDAYTYDTCFNHSCCGSLTCSLSVTDTVTYMGKFGTDLSALAMALPAGWAANLLGDLSFEGSYTKAVATQSTNACTIGKCQYYSLEFGPSYKTTTRTFAAKLKCIDCSPSYYNCFEEEVCEEHNFTAIEWVKRLHDETAVLGDCGIPSPAGCGGASPNPCASPQSNTCPQ